MSEKGITEKILLDTVARFEGVEPSNISAAKLLRKGVAEGKLQNSQWIAEILLNTADSTVTEESSNETSEP